MNILLRSQLIPLCNSEPVKLGNWDITALRLFGGFSIADTFMLAPFSLFSAFSIIQKQSEHFRWNVKPDWNFSSESAILASHIEIFLNDSIQICSYFRKTTIQIKRPG